MSLDYGIEQMESLMRENEALESRIRTLEGYLGASQAEVRGLRAALRRIVWTDEQFREKAARLGSPLPPKALADIARQALEGDEG